METSFMGTVMKFKIILLLFIGTLSCKTETKKESNIITESKIELENKVEKTVLELWNDFIKVNPNFKESDIPESDFFHNNKFDADRLAQLILIGKKKASSGLFILYKQYNIDLPKIGAMKIVTDYNGGAKAIIKTTHVDTIPFYKISDEYAQLDMGTSAEPLKKWKKAHWDFFSEFLKENDGKMDEKMLVVCEKFETIWPIN